jgi:hypothetical protein
MKFSFNLYPNWKEILRKSWAMRFAIAAGLFSGLEVWNSLYGNHYFSPGKFAALSGICSFCSYVSRVVAQKNI